jgi:capsid protein
MMHIPKKLKNPKEKWKSSPEAELEALNESLSLLKSNMENLVKNTKYLEKVFEDLKKEVEEYVAGYNKV